MVNLRSISQCSILFILYCFFLSLVPCMDIFFVWFLWWFIRHTMLYIYTDYINISNLSLINIVHWQFQIYVYNKFWLFCWPWTFLFPFHLSSSVSVLKITFLHLLFFVLICVLQSITYVLMSDLGLGIFCAHQWVHKEATTSLPFPHVYKKNSSTY